MFDISAWILIYSALAIVFALSIEESAPISDRVTIGVLWPIIILLGVFSTNKNKDVEKR